MHPNAATEQTRPTDEAENDIIKTRQDFLHDLGLKWDPFIMPVAEQEVSLSTTSQKHPPTPPKRPVSLAYFTPPPSSDVNGKSILKALQQHKPTFVFGAPGMGKTTLRLALDATLRSTSSRTLTVTYLFSRDLEETRSIEAHATELSRQVAVDLFIQALERFNPVLAAPTQRQVTRLGRLMHLGGRPLRRLARRIINKPDPQGMMGLAQHWYLVNRIPIRYVAFSPPLLDLVKTLLDAMEQEDASPMEGREALQFALETAREWSFINFMVLIDGVDTWHRDEARMFALIEPLLEETAVWQSENLYPTYFLPETLQPQIDKILQTSPSLATLNPSQFTLHWNEADLGRVLRARLRAAGSRRVSLNDLADPAWTDNLDQLLLQEANGSPRRLLKLISRLIDAHLQNVARRDPGDEKQITLSDWQDTLEDFLEIDPD